MRLSIKLAGLAVLLTLLPACSLAGDITPPPGARSASAATPGPDAGATAALPEGHPPVDVSGAMSPVSRPRAADGSLLFADHCTECHGETGQGDGPRVPELPGPPPDFSRPELARQTTPAAWFEIITNGRLEKLMPPWQDTLTADQRWSLVAYLYTLSTSPEQIEAGREIYAAQCAECHGEAGQGDGPQAATLMQPPVDFTDLALMVGRSQQDLFTAVSQGVEEAMPAFADKLSEADRWAVLDYVRTFSYDYHAPGAPIPVQLGVLEGRVENGTGGASLPDGLEVRLHGFDESGQPTAVTTTADAEGRFTFSDVPYRSGTQFVLTTLYQDVTYVSDLLAFSPEQNPLEATLHVYESTSGTGTLRMERMHVFVEFTEPGRVTVGQLILLSNLGDRTLVNPDGPTVEFSLPAGAQDLAVDGEQEGAGYVRTADGFALLRPVFPGLGSDQVLFSFSLPYNEELLFEQKLNYPVAALNLMVADPAVKVQSGSLESQGLQNMQGVQFQNFTRQDLAAGEVVGFDITGQPAATATTGEAAGLPGTVNSASLGLGLGALALVLIGVGVWWYRRASPGAGPTSAPRGGEPSREDLLQAIVELDEAYEAGEVDEREYQRERAWLKGELKKRWR